VRKHRRTAEGGLTRRKRTSAELCERSVGRMRKLFEVEVEGRRQHCRGESEPADLAEGAILVGENDVAIRRDWGQ
jgi:hypothetical protein